MKLILVVAAMLIVAVGCSSVGRIDSSAGTAIPPTDEAQQQLAARGKGQFVRCNSCHVVDQTAPQPFGDSLGPHLEGIVGRPFAAVEDFEYTQELQALDLVWDEETLDRWLEDPDIILPGMCETFMGMANPEHRKALIAYLKNPPK